MLKASRVLILVALMIIVPGQALAYEDTGYDPADREGDYPDIRTTTRSVWKNDDGPRFLRISFTGEEMLGVAAYWEMAVRLDTRGDGSFDVLMRFWDLDMSGTGCFARKRGAGDRVDGTLRLRTHGASCRIDTSQFRLTKEVRWKLKSPALHDPGEVEVAPNRGYYPYDSNSRLLTRRLAKHPRDRRALIDCEEDRTLRAVLVGMLRK